MLKVTRALSELKFIFPRKITLPSTVENPHQKLIDAEFSATRRTKLGKAMVLDYAKGGLKCRLRTTSLKQGGFKRTIFVPRGSAGEAIEKIFNSAS